MSDRRERLAKNEVLFREVNERISDVANAWSVELDLVCECANIGCAEPVHLSVQRYNEIRANDLRFIIAVGHAQQEIECVVDRGDGYEVVEKHAELVDAT